MIAHVAEADEAMGRVVLRFSSEPPNDVAIRAAVKVAQAFRSELESLFVEDEQLIDLAHFPFATEISLTGRSRRELTPRAVHHQFLATFREAQRRVSLAVRDTDVPIRQSYVRDEPVQALASACARRGPWNVVALGEALSSTSCAKILELFESVSDTTGIVIAGPRSRRTTGPIVVAVEDTGRLPGMLPAATRLAELSDAEIRILITAPDEKTYFETDAELRLVLADQANASIVPHRITHGEPACVAEQIRALQGGFLIAHFGSQTLPEAGALRPLLAALECPLFLVR